MELHSDDRVILCILSNPSAKKEKDIFIAEMAKYNYPLLSLEKAKTTITNCIVELPTTKELETFESLSGTLWMIPLGNPEDAHHLSRQIEEKEILIPKFKGKDTVTYLVSFTDEKMLCEKTAKLAQFLFHGEPVPN
jgi:hypothetical protein